MSVNGKELRKMSSVIHILILFSVLLAVNENCSEMPEQNNLEGILNIVNKYTNINKDRSAYKKHFDSVQLQIFKQLRGETLFNELFNGNYMQGSYGENLKISKPDEFDFVFILKLRNHNAAKIKEDPYYAGNVLIDVTETLSALEKDRNQVLFYENLRKWVTENNLLRVDKINSWLNGCFTKALNKLGNEIVVENVRSKLIYKQKGPAHTIIVAGPYNYSVDFVPAFLFSEKQNIFRNCKGDWLAILKPVNGPNNKEISFRSSFYNQEKEIIKNSQNMKNAIRLMKKFRDKHPNMANLKSYYIKTLFLWKANEKRNVKGYWNTPISKIIIEMFHALEETFMTNNLPYYWNKNCNLYRHYSVKQIQEMRKCVQNAKSKMNMANDKMIDDIKHKIYSLFLTNNELGIEGIKRPSDEKTKQKKNTEL